jgi:hypothetical protein
MIALCLNFLTIDLLITQPPYFVINHVIFKDMSFKQFLG